MSIKGLTLAENLDALKDRLEGIKCEILDTEMGKEWGARYAMFYLYPRTGTELKRVEGIKRDGLLISYVQYKEAKYKAFVEDLKVRDPEKYLFLLEYHLNRVIKECAVESANCKEEEHLEAIVEKYFPTPPSKGRPS